ncbi:ATP-dependent DNA ligase [Streptomyces sp. NPDC051578]|uniref:ATP-dependent DNA ligase n=1 Tax=Streptomyces sp. NPDC051578 TaxID=3365662 RepID=UPI0037B615BE
MPTRRGTLIQDRFPDLVAAVKQLPDGLVLDGELIVWETAAGRLSFERLQRRTAARGRAACELAASLPAFFIAFDVLQDNDGVELLPHLYRQRRQRRLRLEALFASHRLKAPWTLCSMTTDLITAQKWLESWTDAPGLEGIVVKAMNQPYRPGYRGWYKLRRRDTTEAITGTLTRPHILLLGRHDTHDRLRPIGRMTPLRPEAGRLVATSITETDEDHPWAGMQFATTCGSRDVLDVTLVRPELVAEISGDASVDHGGALSASDDAGGW